MHACMHACRPIPPTDAHLEYEPFHLRVIHRKSLFMQGGWTTGAAARIHPAPRERYDNDQGGTKADISAQCCPQMSLAPSGFSHSPLLSLGCCYCCGCCLALCAERRSRPALRENTSFSPCFPMANNVYLQWHRASSSGASPKPPPSSPTFENIGRKRRSLSRLFPRLISTFSETTLETQSFHMV